MSKNLFGRHSLVAAVVFVAGLTVACNKTQETAADNSPAQAAQFAPAPPADPAGGNLAPAQYASAPAAPQQPAPQQAAPQQPAPQQYAAYDTAQQSTDYSQNYAPPPPPPYEASGDQTDYSDAVSYEQPVEASQPPPPLPEYSQPPCPGDNYYWTPGYWGYGSSSYYWVPGAWVLAPWVGALWTPPYWGYDSGHYRWHTGYWGSYVGFYGGIDYGYGYTGRGYYGGYWNHGSFVYNRAVTNVNPTVVHNVYNYPVHTTNVRISYNGGHGGIPARPTPQEAAALRAPRTAPVPAQIQHAREASTNRAQFAVAGQVAPAALVAPRPLATQYKTPAPRPPAVALRAAARPAPVTTRPQVQQNERPGEQPGRPPVPENRPVPQPAQRPEVVQRSVHTQPNIPAPAPPQARPEPAARPSSATRGRVPNCRSDLLRNKLPDRNSSKGPRRSRSRVPRRPNALLRLGLKSSNRDLLRNPWRARRRPRVPRLSPVLKSSSRDPLRNPQRARRRPRDLRLSPAARPQRSPASRASTSS